jgi:hypothetical protein
MRNPPFALYFLFAWAAYATFLTAATVVWVQLQFKGLGQLDIPGFLSLFSEMAIRATPGVALYAGYFFVMRGTMRRVPVSLRSVINWSTFFVLTTGGFIAMVAIAERSYLELPTSWLDLAPIFVSASLAMLFFGQLRKILFAMATTGEGERS